MRGRAEHKRNVRRREEYTQKNAEAAWGGGGNDFWGELMRWDEWLKGAGREL